MKTRSKKIKISFLSVLLLFTFFLGQSYALQTITLKEGETAFVDISSRDLNLIKFSTPGIKVYTSSKTLEIKVDGSNVFVYLPSSFDSLGSEEVITDVKKPHEVFFVTPHGTFSLVLVPKSIPSETIIVRTTKEEGADAVKWESSHDYVTGLKELIKAMYVERPPMGFSVQEIKKDVTVWKGTKQMLVSTYQGATLLGEVHKISNLTDKPIRMVEKEFYRLGVLAVSIDKHEIGPKEETFVYIVKKSETQKQLEKVLQKQNPLDVLRTR